MSRFVTADIWQFWRDQLDGLEPETTPGTPHAGYYILRRRLKTPNPKPGPGKPRNKVTETHLPVAIWQDDGRWIAFVGRNEEYTDADYIDERIFSVACRRAITFEEYQEMLNHADQ